jgi:hypothetical protein
MKRFDVSHAERAIESLQRSARNKLAYAAFMLVCAASAAWSVAVHAQRTAIGAPAPAHEWPSTWDGRLLRPLALSEVELRFAAQFPGAIARLTDGERQFVMREVNQPTRMLHPAVDCYRALGYRIDAARLETDTEQRRWRCFEAQRDGQHWRVCERIVDADGAAYTDTSSWFWAAMLGRSRGPWQAITTAQPS